MYDTQGAATDGLESDVARLERVFTSFVHDIKSLYDDPEGDRFEGKVAELKRARLEDEFTSFLDELNHLYDDPEHGLFYDGFEEEVAKLRRFYTPEDS